MLKEQIVLTVPRGTLKFKKIMAATNWTIIRRNKRTGTIVMYDLETKWTYKTALGIAIESNMNETHELVCVVETSKILLKNEKDSKNKEELPIG